MMSKGNPTAGITSNRGWGLEAFTADDLERIHHASLELLESCLSMHKPFE